MNAIDASVSGRGLNPQRGLAPRYAPRRRPAARSVRSAAPRRYRAEAARRSRAWIGLTVAIVAGALMMIAAYMSASGLSNQAWEKERPATAEPAHQQPQAATPASAGVTYVTEPAAATQP